MARPHTQNVPGQDTKGSIKIDTSWKTKAWTTKEHLVQKQVS